MRHVTDDARVMHAAPAGAVHALQPVVLHGVAVFQTEQPHALEQRPPGQKRGVIHRRQVGAQAIGVVRVTAVHERRTVVAVEHQVAEHEIGAALLQRGHRLRQLAVRQPVIGVQELYVGAACQRHALVERVGDAAVRLADPEILRPQVVLQQCLGAVCGAAIDHHLFDDRPLLRLHRRDGALHCGRPVAHHSDDADARRW